MKCIEILEYGGPVNQAKLDLKFILNSSSVNSARCIYNFNICFAESWSSKVVFQELEALKQQVIGRHVETRPREKLKYLQGNLHTFRNSEV